MPTGETNRNTETLLRTSGKRELVMATGFLFVVLALGTLGYSLIEGWPVDDSLYMTFLTLTTIGFNEVHELSHFGRFFTIALGLAGIGSVALIATRSAQLLFNTRAIRIRQMNKLIERTTDHYIVAGYGRIGSRVAQDLKRHDVPFIIIENDPEKREELENENVLLVIGNAEEDDTLKQAGISRAKGLILTLPEDSSNVFATLVARELNPDLFILARTDTYMNRRKLIRAGADKVVAPYEIGADRMAQVLLRPNVDQFMDRVLSSGGLNFTMEEVRVGPNSTLAGKTLAENDFRQRFDTIVVGIVNGSSGELTFNPGPAEQIQVGDILIVMGTNAVVDRLKQDCLS